MRIYLSPYCLSIIHIHNISLLYYLELRSYPYCCLRHELLCYYIWHLNVTHLSWSFFLWLFLFGCFFLIFCCFLCLLCFIFKSCLQFLLCLRSHKGLDDAGLMFCLFFYFLFFINILQGLNLIFLWLNRLLFFYLFNIFYFLLFNFYRLNITNMFPLVDSLCTEIIDYILVKSILISFLWIYTKIKCFYCLFCRPLLEYGR